MDKGWTDNVVSAHSKNHNCHSMGVCYIEGLASNVKTPEDIRTEAQKCVQRELLEDLHECYLKIDSETS